MTTAFLRPPFLTSWPAAPFPQFSCVSLTVTPSTSSPGRRRVQIRKCCSSTSSAFLPTLCKAGSLRRDVVLLGCCSAMTVIFPISGLRAGTKLDEDVRMALLVADINAYSFLYPVEIPEKKFSFKWVESRKPERYSSAAPLSPDARQRIVSERVDMINNLVISVSIGPPNLRYLVSNDKNSWKARDIADSVLSDKSALPVSTSQRMIESSVLDAHASEVDGDVYWYYEYLVRKSPTKSAQESNLYRHNVASTAERDGYLYSLNASTLSKKWESLGSFLQKTVASFRLLPPTENYVPPYKDPWRFW